MRVLAFVLARTVVVFPDACRMNLTQFEAVGTMSGLGCYSISFKGHKHSGMITASPNDLDCLTI